jgi:hypothetical protein
MIHERSNRIRLAAVVYQIFVVVCTGIGIREVYKFIGFMF